MYLSAAMTTAKPKISFEIFMQQLQICFGGGLVTVNLAEQVHHCLGLLRLNARLLQALDGFVGIKGNGSPRPVDR